MTPSIVPIIVTKQLIKNGKRGHSASCPIARALRKKYPSFKITVSSKSATLENSRTLWGAQAFLPTRAKRFVNKFDDGQKVKPLSFVLKFFEI